MASDFDSLFSIERELGRGGYGKVFRVKRKDSGKVFALKVINLEAVDYVQAIREVQVMKGLNHPHVVKYYCDFESYVKGENGLQLRQLAIQMDYCPGGDLATVIGHRVGVPFKCQRVIKWMLQLSSAVSYIHSLKILHRDLKPQNILLDSCGNFKLADFGISTCGAGEAKPAGTQLFSAPEVLHGRYGMESDLYSLGCVYLCIVSCKTTPRPCVTSPFTSVSTRYGQRIVDVIRNCLKKEPSLRWTADKVLSYLANTPVESKNVCGRVFSAGSSVNVQERTYDGKGRQHENMADLTWFRQTRLK